MTGHIALEPVGVPTGTQEQWVQAAAAVLRKSGKLPDGADVDRDRILGLLGRRTLEGLTVPPLGAGTGASGIPTTRRATDTTDGWDIRSWITDPDPAAAKAAVVGELEGGATSILLTVGSGATAPADLADVLDPVLLDVAPVVLHSPEADPAALDAFASFVRNNQADPAPGTSFGADPLAVALRTGGGHRPSEVAEIGSVAVIDSVAEIGSAARDLDVRAFVVDGTAAHELGAGDAQEIGWTLAVGVSYLRVLTESGLALDDAVGLIDFRYAVTDNQFGSIAKLRAARQLWARVLELSGAATAPQRQHAVTSRSMSSRYDPWVNMLRGTVAAFAAGAGGAQSVTVLPFDIALGIPDAFGRRIARNVSHLLIGESHVAAVADPAGGAPAVEQLTDELAAAGWAEFGRIESAGGAPAVLTDGSFAERVAAVRDELRARIATRKVPLTGVSEFANPTEQLPQRRPGPEFTGFSWPADFEALRDSPVTTPVFLATLGSAAAHTARAGFVRNALAAAGIGTVVAGPTQTVDEVVAAYDPAVTNVVCLAGADPDYAASGAGTIAALRAAGATTVLLAGTPSAELADLVDDHIAIGANIPELSVRIRRYLGQESR